MAVITVGTISSANMSSNATSLTYSATHDVGKNLFVVAVSSVKQGGTSNPTINSVTYGGVSMTRAVTSLGSYRLSEIWYLETTTTGTANVVVTTADNGTMVSGAISLGNAKASPLNATGNSQPYNTQNWSCSINNVTDNSIIINANCQDYNRTPTSRGIGQVIFYGSLSAEGANQWGDYKIATASGNTTITFVLSNVSEGSMACASFDPIPNPKITGLTSITGTQTITM